MSIKEFFTKLKDNAAKATKVTARYNSIYFLGNIDRGLKDGDFGQGTYLNMEKTTGLIYGVNIEDYTFTAGDIAGFEVDEAYKAEIGKSGTYHPAKRCMITFKDGRKAQADILANQYDVFIKRFGLDNK